MKRIFDWLARKASYDQFKDESKPTRNRDVVFMEENFPIGTEFSYLDSKMIVTELRPVGELECWVVVDYLNKDGQVVHHRFASSLVKAMLHTSFKRID